ncbi:Uncharacterised protein [Mycobacterium tuberculosis]|nr:Uncharacterised protein [Mycobacterium tuberculosis]
MPRCSAVSSACRCNADGVTSTRTSSPTRSGAIAASRIAVNPPSDMPTTNSAPGASSRSTGAKVSELSCGE